MAILDFSVSGRHGFGSVTQVCFGISVSNFMCMSFVAIGINLTIVSYVAFKVAALWFWTMFNCNPPIAHCHPLPWGGGILVDHWSTISSFAQKKLQQPQDKGMRWCCLWCWQNKYHLFVAPFYDFNHYMNTAMFADFSHTIYTNDSFCYTQTHSHMSLGHYVSPTNII